MVSISVIINCYREGLLLRDALASVRSQTIQPLEVLLVNDGSPDALTNSICREVEASGDARVLWLDPNRGATAARNAGFDAAQGDILVPLDGDDLLPHDALEKIRAIFADNPACDFIAGSFIMERSPSRKITILGSNVSLPSLLRARRLSLGTNWTLHGCAPLRKALWRTAGRYNETLGSKEVWDVDFWVRAMHRGARPHGTREVLYIWRRHLGSECKQVSATSWATLAQNHFDAFQSCGLTYRAYELLLLGSMWTNDSAEIRQYRRKLMGCIVRLRCQLSSIIICASPAWLFRVLVRRLRPYA